MMRLEASFLAALLALGQPPAAAQEGLDLGFGRGGVVELPIEEPAWMSAHGIAVDPAGRTILAGSGIMLGRFLADGTPDPTFGVAGFVDLQGYVSYVARVRLDGMGRILLCAMSAVVRLLPDGSRDPSFGSRGNSEPVEALDVVEIEDGGLIGFSSHGLFKLRPNGTLDPAFGIGGRVASDESLRSMALSSEGARVWLAGPSIHGRIRVESRWTADGALDTGFGQGGIAEIALEHPEGLDRVAAGPDGTVLLGGAVPDLQDLEGRVLAVVRLDSKGRLDSAFGEGGVVRTRVRVGGATPVVVSDPGGRVVMAGVSESGLGVVLRLEADGSPDPALASGESGTFRWARNTRSTCWSMCHRSGSQEPAPSMRRVASSS